MTWIASYNEDDEQNKKFYEDYEMTEALADFFRRALKEETALFKWSY